MADTSRSLIRLLREEMTPEPIVRPELIRLASPAERGDAALSLYLYSVQEHGESRQTHMLTPSPDSIRFPPLAIKLQYLLTAYSQTEGAESAYTEQAVLGRAMQVLYDHSILRGSLLYGTLADHNEEVRIVMDMVPAELMSRIWNFSGVSYRTSVSYTVGPVYLDSTRIRTTKRVLEREIRIEG